MTILSKLKIVVCDRERSLDSKPSEPVSEVSTKLRKLYTWTVESVGIVKGERLVVRTSENATMRSKLREESKYMQKD